MRMWATLVLSTLFAPAALVAGSYLGTAACTFDADCSPATPLSSPNGETVPPFAITHPLGYDGSGGVLQLRVCVASGSEILIEPARRAIDTWNQLLATTENCDGCKVWEEGPFQPATSMHAETTLLHEIGHCPLALDHPDRNWDAQVPPDGVWENTSFTRSWGVRSPPDGIQVGPDFIRGTLDDVHSAPPSQGTVSSVSWFRIMDNNPFLADGTVIDIDTFSRSVTSLPSSHFWPSNANRRVGETLGFQNTQSAMYSLQVEGEETAALTADDVAMIRMGMTGQDLMAGTVDDYTIQLELVEPCEDPIDVLIALGSTPEGTVGFCLASVDYSFPQNPMLARHMTIEPPLGQSLPLVIFLDEGIDWDTGPEIVFENGFESGDFSGWNVVTP